METVRRLPESFSSILIVFILSISGCAAPGPITVSPVPEPPSVYASGEITKRYYLSEVIDKRGYADSNNIGFTKGMHNLNASLLSDPPPSTVLRQSLADILGAHGALATTQTDADYLINVDLISFNVTERTTWVSEKITASIEYEVEVRKASSGKRVKRFIVTAEDSQSAFDTTKYAEDVARNAVKKTLSQFAENIKKLNEA